MLPRDEAIQELDAWVKEARERQKTEIHRAMLKRVAEQEEELAECHTPHTPR